MSLPRKLTAVQHSYDGTCICTYVQMHVPSYSSAAVQDECCRIDTRTRVSIRTASICTVDAVRTAALLLLCWYIVLYAVQHYEQPCSITHSISTVVDSTDAMNVYQHAMQ